MTSATPSISILLARLAGTQVGFSALAVREIVRAVAIAPLPGAPAIIEGAINVRGRIVPVVDVRQRLGLPALTNGPEQFLILLEAADRLVAIRVEDVEDVADVPAGGLESPSAVSPVIARLSGVAAMETGALVIYDAGSFLTQAEREALDAAEAAAE